MTDASLPDLADLVKQARPEPPSPTDRAMRSVVFFDLVGSTARKLELGHNEGVAAAATHNQLCRTVVDLHDGVVLKEMGDGILAIFEDPLKAVLAAENARTGLALHSGLSTKVGLTFGMIDLIEVDGRPDALGATVDRAARIQSAALPNQVLVDHVQVEAVRDYLRDIDGIGLGAPDRFSLRGLGEVELWPIESELAGAAPPGLPERLRVYGTGRLPIADKRRFMNYAESEVVELGTGLITFASYFTNLNPDAWKIPVREMLARGVLLRCFALDPDSEAARAYYDLRGEADYEVKARSALGDLRKIRDQFREEGLDGLQLATYRSLPTFYALGVDLNGERGGLQVSPYLAGVSRAECPVFAFSKSAEPDLYERIRQSIKMQIADAQPIE